MKTAMKIFGILLLVFGIVVSLAGLAGAVANFAFPPNDLVCKFADESYKKAQEAVKRYESAKGTSGEDQASFEAKRALDVADADQKACANSKANYKFWGIVFSVAAVFGVFVVLLGGIFTFAGFRRKTMP